MDLEDVRGKMRTIIRYDLQCMRMCVTTTSGSYIIIIG